MDTVDYLRRLGLAGPPSAWAPHLADSAGRRLRVLAEAHLARVPFENLDLHAGEPVSVDHLRILHKIVTRNRGGICYELNGGLGWLLERLGWRVAYHAGRVRQPDGTLGLPMGHLSLVVSAAALEQRWLVDVGFGGDPVLGPVDEIATGIDGPEIEAVVRGADRRPAGYLLETRCRPLADFAGMAWWHSTAPQARFAGSLVCSVTVDGVRTTLSGRRLKITEVDRVVEERTLRSAAEVLAVYRDTYGLTLAAEPVQRQPVANGSPR